MPWHRHRLFCVSGSPAEHEDGRNSEPHENHGRHGEVSGNLIGSSLPAQPWWSSPAITDPECPKKNSTPGRRGCCVRERSRPGKGACASRAWPGGLVRLPPAGWFRTWPASSTSSPPVSSWLAVGSRPIGPTTATRSCRSSAARVTAHATRAVGACDRVVTAALPRHGFRLTQRGLLLLLRSGHGRVPEAVEAAPEDHRSGVRPDEITDSVAPFAVQHAGLVIDRGDPVPRDFPGVKNHHVDVVELVGEKSFQGLEVLPRAMNARFSIGTVCPVAGSMPWVTRLSM